jgi:hypothetical protein
MGMFNRKLRSCFTTNSCVAGFWNGKHLHKHTDGQRRMKCGASVARHSAAQLRASRFSRQNPVKADVFPKRTFKSINFQG